MHITEIFNDVADVIAHLAPEQVVKLKAPLKMSQRVEILVNKRKENNISQEEIIELERFLALDLFISLTKARARVLITA